MRNINIVEDKKYIHIIHTCIAILENLLFKKDLLSDSLVETIYYDLAYIEYCYRKIIKGKKLKNTDKESLIFYYKDYTYKFEKLSNIKDKQSNNYEKLIFNKFNLTLVSNFYSLFYDYLKLIKDEEYLMNVKYRLKVIKKYDLQICEIEKSIKDKLNNYVKVNQRYGNKEIEIEDSEIEKFFTAEDLVKLKIIEDYLEDNLKSILGNVRVQQLYDLERNIEKNNIILNMLKENQVS